MANLEKKQETEQQIEVVPESQWIMHQLNQILTNQGAIFAKLEEIQNGRKGV